MKAKVRAVRRTHAPTLTAVRRAQNTGYSNYGANLQKKSLRGWTYYGGDAKRDIEDNINTLRQRSRDAYMGVPTATAALKTLRTNTVAAGLTPTPQLDGEYLRMWTGSPNCRQTLCANGTCGQKARCATRTGWTTFTSCNSWPTYPRR